MEEVNERAFLFGGKCGANVEHLAIGAIGVHGDLLDVYHQLEGPSRPLGVWDLLGGPLLDGHELGGGDNSHGMLITLHLALVGALK